MNHINCHKTVKTPRKSKDTRKTPQELYDQYIRKGDEAIIAEDIILAEKYYQHADHYLRMMNDPMFVENGSRTQPLPSPCLAEQLIAKSLKGITAERAARKEALMKKAREVVKAGRSRKREDDQIIPE
jgi:hypothetical protein